MKLPSGVHFRSELSLLLWKPRGILNERVVNRILVFIREEEAQTDRNEFRFIDTTMLTAVELSFHYIFHVALYRRMSRQGRRSLKSAFLIKDQAFAHYFKLHALLTDHSPLHVRLFENKDAAAKWLNVSLESLRHPRAMS
jgi:23S rRNA G2445 N2-methylase RlmL